MHDLSSTGLEKHIVAAKIFRPRFEAGTTNDIAVIELMEDVDISIYTPACLTRRSETYPGEYAWTYGQFKFQTLLIFIILNPNFFKAGELELMEI